MLVRMSERRTETIICPKCGRTQEAVVAFDDGMPFPALVHACECGYTILESEWEKVEEVER